MYYYACRQSEGCWGKQGRNLVLYHDDDDDYEKFNDKRIEKERKKRFFLKSKRGEMNDDDDDGRGGHGVSLPVSSIKSQLCVGSVYVFKRVG